MTDSTFHMTKEDVRKPESQASAANNGNVPADSDAAAAQVRHPALSHLRTCTNTHQSIVDSAGTKSKADIIEERKANLPLPDQPPAASDFNSADGSVTNVGSGAQPTAKFSKGDDALRSPATNAESLAGVGREGMEGGLPNDAAARGAKDKAGLVDTTNADKKGDPADTSKLP